jgi:hypothetical protein
VGGVPIFRDFLSRSGRFRRTTTVGLEARGRRHRGGQFVCAQIVRARRSLVKAHARRAAPAAAAVNGAQQRSAAISVGILPNGRAIRRIRNRFAEPSLSDHTSQGEQP